MFISILTSLETLSMDGPEQILIGANKYDKKLKKLIEPVNQYFGISSVTYFQQSTDENHNFINISSTRDWIEHCMKNQYYNEDPHFVHPDKIGAGNIFWHSNEVNYDDARDYDKKIVKKLSEYNISSAYIVVRKEKDLVKIFSFGAPKECTNFTSRICSGMSVINKFLDYFDSELDDVRTDLKKYNVSLSTLKGEKFYTQKSPIEPKYESRIKKIEFLIKIGLLKPNFQDIDLSKREKQIVEFFLEGNSAKATSDFLNISRRTVESHIENIKAKLKVTLKCDLFSIVKVLKEFELI